jgi:ornithine cyclodeaminase/alanine dehydrogenase-like protein (mu-crystallin family)
MKVLIFSQDDVLRLLPMAECIEVMDQALRSLAQNKVTLPLRSILKPAGVKGVLAQMPAFRAGEQPLFGLKAICVFPGNAKIGKDAHQGGVMLFSGETGELLAIGNASAITAIRTAAVSAVATRSLAREDAGDLAIIGAGIQARSHLEAMTKVRSIKRTRVASARIDHARQFTAEMQPHFSFPIEPVETPELAVRNADLIVTATTAREPVIRHEWIAPGTHINAIGTYSPLAREIDTATMAAARLFVDRRESALNEAGDYLIAAKEGAIGPEHIRAELGEVLIGAEPGRNSPDEITVFKSLGLAIEDLAAAEHIYRKAQQQGAGNWVEF